MESIHKEILLTAKRHNEKNKRHPTTITCELYQAGRWLHKNGSSNSNIWRQADPVCVGSVELPCPSMHLHTQQPSIRQHNLHCSMDIPSSNVAASTNKI